MNVLREPVLGITVLFALLAAALVVRVILVELALRRARGAKRDVIERRYNLLEAVADGLYVVDRDERISDANEEAERLLGVLPGTLVGKRLPDVVDQLASDLVPEIREARVRGAVIERTAHFAAAGRTVEIRVVPAAEETTVVLRDATERARDERRAHESERRLYVMARQVPALLWTVDRRGRFTSMSGAAMATLSLAAENMIAQSFDTLVPGGIDKLLSVYGGDSLRYDAPYAERWLRHHVEPLRDAGGVIVGAVGVSLDITEVRDGQQKLHVAARRDALTNLPNRLALEERLPDLIARAAAEGRSCALLFIDLDRFKTINDTLGHRVGDLVLKSVAERLRSVLPSRCLIARPGGDEFIVALPDVAGTDEVVEVSTNALRALTEALHVDGRELFVGASVGAALAPRHGHDAAALITAADTAMYRAKAEGRGRFAFYDAAMQRAAIERLAVEQDLRIAIARGELRLMYQPIYDAQTSRVLGAEALCRWKHPRRGELLPEQFIAVAEETGLIVPITRWALREACMFAAKVRRKRPDFTVAVNLSPRDLYEADLEQIVADALFSAELDPAALDLEITENVALDARAVEALHRIRGLGVGIAVDDFGTAYNSLAYVKRLPITSIKVDKTFVHDIDHDAFDRAIVEAVVTMASSLSLRVVAEGIETDAQWEAVVRLGAQRLQGYRFSRPIERDAIDALLLDDRVVSLARAAG